MEVKRWVVMVMVVVVEVVSGQRQQEAHARTHSLHSLTLPDDSEWLEWQRTRLLPVQAPRAACGLRLALSAPPSLSPAAASYLSLFGM